MATTLQLRRYNTATVAGLTGADGEVFVDTTKKTLVVQDGSTAGGTPLATETFVTSGLASLQTTVSAALVNYAISSNLNRIAFAGLSSVGTSIIPASNLTYSLGSLTRQWKDLYLGTSTLYVGGIAIGVSPGGRITVDGDSAPATAGLEPAGTYWHWNSLGLAPGSGGVGGGAPWNNIVRAGDYFYTHYSNPTVYELHAYKYSRDGINWEGTGNTSLGVTAATVPGSRFDVQLSPVRYNKKWIAYGNGTYVMPKTVSATSSTVFRSCYTSTDGTSWTERVNAFPQGAAYSGTIYYEYWNAVIWDGSRFVLMSNGDSGFIHNARLLTSTNGQSWTQISPAAGGELLGASTSLLTGYLWGTQDAYDSSLGVVATRITPTDIEYGNGIYVASVKLDFSIGFNTKPTNRVYVSADAASWSYVTLPTEAVWWQVIYGDGVFVMQGYDPRDIIDTRRVVRSADNGATWTRVTELGVFPGAGESLGNGANAHALSYGDGRWVLCKLSSPVGKVLVSTDNAQTFSKLTLDLAPTNGVTYESPFTQSDYYDSAYGDGTFVIIGGTGTQYSKATVKASIEAPTITVGSGASSITLTTTSGDLVIDGVPLLSSISVSISSALTSYATISSIGVSISSALTSYATISSIGSLTTSITSSILFSVSSTYVSVSSLTSSVSFYISSSLTSYVTVSSLSSSVSFYVSSALTSYVTVDTISSYLTSYLTVDTVSSYLTSYVTLDSLSSTLTSLGTVSDLNLGSDALIFTGDSTTSLELGTLFTSASIGAGASSILIRNPSFDMGYNILNLTSGSTIFADVSSSSTNIQIPFDLISQATWVSSWGQIIYSNYGYSPSLGGGSSYLISGYTSSTVNTSATHVIRLSRNAYESQVTLYEGTDFTIAGSSVTINPTWTFVYLWQLFETTGTTTSVLLIPVAPNTDTQNSWSGDPVYFNNLDVGYTTSSSTFNGSNPGKLVYTNPNGVQYYEDGTIIYPNGSVQSPGNFNLYTSSGSTNFQFTSSGNIVLPSGAHLYSGLYSGYPGAGFVTGVATLAATQVYLSNTSGSSYIGIDDTNRVILGYDDTTKYWLFDSSGAIVLPVGGDIKNSSGNSVYATNANLTSTLSSYATKTFVTSALTSYTTNANLTSTLSSYATKGPAFSVFPNSSVTQTITSGSQQKVLFQQEEFDTDNCYASSRFTPTVAGYYQLNATVRISGTMGTGESMLIIWKNGSEWKRGWNASGTEVGASFFAMQVSSLVYANGTGDFFEIYIQQGSGGNRDITVAGGNITYFNGCMVRGA
jgi:hypothetical protein